MAVAFTISVLVGCVIVWYYYDTWINAGDYWNGLAPDGEYTAFVCTVNLNDSSIFTPLCENSGGDLHGTWKYDNNIFEVDKFMTYNGRFKTYVSEYWKVELKNGIIVGVHGT